MEDNVNKRKRKAWLKIVRTLLERGETIQQATANADEVLKQMERRKLL